MAKQSRRQRRSDKRSLGAVLGTVLLAGCATPAALVQIHLKAPDESEFQAYKGAGPASVQGQGFLRQKGGGTVTCAGSDVHLLPATPYVREAVQIILSGRQPIPKPTDAAFGTARRSQCDAQGNFTFTNIPAQKWIVTTRVTWTVGDSTQGGTLLKEIDVAQNSGDKVLLTDNDIKGR